MLNLQAMMDDVESRAGRIGVLMPDLCEQANVHRRSWHRWRHSIVSPSFSKWNNIVGTLEELELQSARAKHEAMLAAARYVNREPVGG